MGSQIWSMVVTWARMASMASMVASMASMVLMDPRATMEAASAALKASKAGLPVLRWSKLGNEAAGASPAVLRTFIEQLAVVSTTIMAVEDDGPRSLRRVDDAKVKKELVGCQLWPLVGGDEWWRRWVASMVGVDGGCDGWRRWLASMVASNGGVDG